IDMINNCEWLSSSGKVSMIEKFNNITFCLGGPEAHEINASDALLIGDSLFETIRNIKANEAFEHIQKLNEAPDLLEWDMAPQTVNACFSPPANAIFITAAILNAPFFDLNSDYYTNLGGLGAVICHELSHAFDPMGMEYDSSGNYNPEWVSQEDRDNLDAIQSSVIDYYNDFTILEVYHVDGELTACENLADIGSVQCILSMCNNEDDIRALFINYACIWEMLFHDNVILESLTEDVHSPASTRVNAVVSCFDEFYEIFDVSEGDQMYVRPENRVRRW
ncbi:MAG TPA: M13-type metalloendopeptidase, partial [Saccharofermentans sp.]|nr:M13-type metalloendopeptidase [Saccharofermentans sp.]